MPHRQSPKGSTYQALRIRVAAIYPNEICIPMARARGSKTPRALALHRTAHDGVTRRVSPTRSAHRLVEGCAMVPAAELKVGFERHCGILATTNRFPYLRVQHSWVQRP